MSRPPSKPAGSSSKRSEVNELRASLMSLEVQRDPKRYRETCQKVIMYMTLGIDVSQLFTEMIMASATQNLVQKKLVYLYLCTYAESHSELTLLAINTLQKDCRDSNPMIRGLALRAICGLKVQNLVEYAMVPLMACLQDKSPYVRKTAALGCVKLFYISRDAIEDQNVPETLYAMLQDRDAQVVANCVIALEEILAAEGGLLLTKEVVVRLMNRLTEFTEWNQCVIMGVVARYQTADEDECFDMLNILDDRLKHSNTGVVLAAAKLFLHFTQGMPDVQADVYGRLKVPLITQMSSSPPEISYTVLTHIDVLLERCPDLFLHEYKALYCRYNDPSYIKWKKLEILTIVASPANMVPIVEELSANATDVDAEMARHAIRALGRIAVKLPEAVDHCVAMMMAFMELGTDYVTAETLVLFKDVLRKYPHKAEECAAHVLESVEQDMLTGEPAARTAHVWMLGQYGEQFEEAPYVLEAMIDNWDEEDSAKVRLEILTTAVRLFFARPPEMQLMLGRLLDRAIEEELHMDVHDRALLYYRLLRQNLSEAQQVIASSLPAIEEFVEMSAANRARKVEEFNTLCVIYSQPATSFVQQTTPYAPVDQDVADAREAMEFEMIWVSSETSAVVKDVLNVVPSTATAHEIQKCMANCGVTLMASSPPQNGAIKFFFYGQEEGTGMFHLAEASLELSSRMFSASVRSQSVDTAPLFGMVLREALSKANLIDMGM